MDDFDRRLIIYFIGIFAVIIAFIVGVVLCFYFQTKPAENGSQTPITLNECVVYAPNISYIPYVYTLGSLVDCLEEKESNCNPLAVGKAGEIGCMQFMPSTFQSYCVEKYGLINDIWDCEIQRECADKMLIDGGINHWTTKNLCL